MLEVSYDALDDHGGRSALFEIRNNMLESQALHRLLVFSVVAAAFLVRIISIWSGYPLVVHPDEHNIVEAAWNIARSGDLNPHLFDYPAFFIYVQALLYTAVATLERIVSATSMADWPDVRFYIYSRALNVVISTATIFVVYEIGKRLFNPWVGLLAMCFIGASHLHMANSIIVSVDSSVALWSSLSAFMAVLIYTRGERLRFSLAGGAFAGLAVGSKYTAFLAVLPMIVAHLAGGAQKRRISRNLLYGLIAVPAVFFATSPYIVLDFQAFSDAMSFVRGAYSVSHPGADALASTSYLVYLKGLAAESYGMAPSALALAGMAVLFATERWKAVMLSSFAFALFLFVGSYRVYYLRNITAMIPVLSLFSAYALYVVLDRCREKLSIVLRPQRLAAAIGALGTVLIILSVYGQASACVHEAYRSTLPDTRWISLNWVRDHIPAGARIGRNFYGPPIEAYSDAYEISFLSLWGNDPRRPQKLADLPTLEYLILSSDDYDRFVNHPGEYPNEHALYQSFFHKNELLKEFVPDAKTLSGPTIKIYKTGR